MTTKLEALWYSKRDAIQRIMPKVRDDILYLKKHFNATNDEAILALAKAGRIPEGLSYRELGDLWGISRARAKQIEDNAVHKFRRMVEKVPQWQKDEWRDIINKDTK